MKLFLEQNFHWAVWSGGVLYCLWCFCQSAYANYAVLDPEDFKKGWGILHRNKDVSDTEWVVLTTMFKKFWALIVLQICVSHMISCKFIKILPLFYASYSVMCLVLIIGKHATMVCVVHVLCMCAIHAFGNKIVCYFFTVVALYVLHMPYSMQARESIVSGKMENFLLEVGLAWQIARCLSFTIDRIDDKVHRRMKIEDFAVIFSYCFYLPVVFTGPIVNYNVFAEKISASHRKWTQTKLLAAVQQVLRPILYYFALEFMLHYVYSSSVQYYPELVGQFNAWALCGLGYALPTLFYVKYFAVYGLAGALARLEHFEFPPPPKCISRIHRSSFLWRHFDRGLYLWILQYLYLPLVNGKWTVFRKIVALSLCFSFVCMWHGMDKAVCAWTTLNFFAVASEMIFSYIGSFKFIRKIDKSLSPNNQRRCQALISTPHFIIMCLSATFFLSNWDIGVLVWKNVICGGLIPLLPTAFIMYCGCHVGMDVQESEDKKGKGGKFNCLDFSSKKIGL